MRVKYLILTGIFLVSVFMACADNKEVEGEQADEQVLTEREAALEVNDEQKELEGSNIIAQTMEVAFLSTFTNALKIGDLSETLRKAKGPFTVFAPTDEAFYQVRDINMDSLITNRNQERLREFLKYHIVEGEITSVELRQEIMDNNGEYTFSTLVGEDITATINDENLVLRDASGSTATIIQSDVDASNGVVHIIDAVIMKKKS